jgi:hypothetical protein
MTLFMKDTELYKSGNKLANRTLQYICLPQFKPVTTADLPQIRLLLQRGVSRSCDYTVGGISLWSDWFEYEYCIVRNTLFIKGLSESNRQETAFSLPIGDMGINESIDLLQHYCSIKNMPLVFSAIPEDCMNMFCDVRRAGIEALDAWSDYVYNAADLATLAGKRFQKKRNHVNRFVAENPGYEMRVVTADDYGELAVFFDALRDADDADDSVMARYEGESVAQMLAAGNPAGFEGALLRDNSGSVVAFTFGEVIGDTLHVHIEKMRHDVPGAGAAINKMYVESMLSRYPQIRYVNRQDDAGDEGLRQAKLSYNPAFILKKYNVYIK